MILAESGTKIDFRVEVSRTSRIYLEKSSGRSWTADMLVDGTGLVFALSPHDLAEHGLGVAGPANVQGERPPACEGIGPSRVAKSMLKRLADGDSRHRFIAPFIGPIFPDG